MVKAKNKRPQSQPKPGNQQVTKNQPEPVEYQSDPEPKVEEINDKDTISNALGEAAEFDQETIEKAKFLVRQQTRGEKKAKKAFENLGLEHLSGIVRVVFKRARNELIVIAKPEVYKATDSDVYVIYGEPSMANGNLPPQALAAEQLARKQYAKMLNKQDPSMSSGAPITSSLSLSNQENEHEMMEDDAMPLPPGMEEKDVELVMTQGDVSRSQAIKAIQKCNGDVVNAIMEVTST